MTELGSEHLQPFYQREALHFKCTKCGACCLGNHEYYVFVSLLEINEIQGFLGLTKKWFRRKYTKRLSDGDLVLQQADDGRCVFLDRQGKCRIYPVRPIQCQTYPFWPEIVNSSHAWFDEARRCEGINHGPVVPLHRIKAALKSS